MCPTLKSLRVTLCVILSLPFAVAHAAEDDWAFGVEVYGWGASVGGTAAQGQDIDIDFDTLFDNLHGAFMGAFAAKKGKWMLVADLVYVDIKGDKTVSRDVQGVPISIRGDIRSKLTVGTVVGGYEFLESGDTKLSVVAGTRYGSLDNDLEVRVNDVIDVSVSDSGHNWDAIVGLRGHTDFNEKWYLTYEADLGAGDSDLVWQALVGVNYRFAKLDALLGYRYLEYQFDDDDPIYDDLDLNGPFAGLKFRF